MSGLKAESRRFAPPVTDIFVNALDPCTRRRSATITKQPPDRGRDETIEPQVRDPNHGMLPTLCKTALAERQPPRVTGSRMAVGTHGRADAGHVRDLGVRDGIVKILW